MRNAQRDQITLHYATVTTEKVGTRGEGKQVFGSPQQFKANLQTASGQAAAAEYGQRLPYVMRLYGASLPLKEGMGIWVDADISKEPDYEVKAIPRTPQTRTTTIERRGAYGG